MAKPLPVAACAAPAILLAALLLLPFLHKAYTVDDTLFLRQAEHALVDPLHPAAVDVVWTDHTERLSAIMPSGPVMPWLLAPALRRGADEALAHLIVFFLLTIGLAATAAFALRLGLGRVEATLAALLVACTPAVLGMAATVMPDVAAMSLGVFGMERFYAWRDGRRALNALAAALLLALAAMARSHLILLLPVAALALAGDEIFTPRRLLRLAPLRRLALEMWPLMLALVITAVVMRVTRDPQRGSGVASSVFHFMSWRHLDRNILAFAIHSALSLPLVIPWLIVRRRAAPWRLLLLAVPAAAALFLAAGHLDRAWLLPFAAAAAVAYADIFRDGWRRRDATQLALGLWLLVPLPIAVYLNLAPKFLTASTPAACILVVRLLARERSPRAARAHALTACALGALLGVLIIRADAAFAGAARDAARVLITPRVERGETVWFAGHWGWQWYAEQAGARIIDMDAPPAPGAIVVASHISDGRVIHHFPRRRFLTTRVYDAPGGRIFTRGAGFYTNTHGYLPWSWGSDVIDRFDTLILQ